MNLKTLFIALLLAIAMPFNAFAHNHSQLAFEHSWIKLPIPGMQMTGGFINITNNGAQDEQLIAVHSEIAKTVELHSMVMVDGVMKMRAVDGGWTIPAGETISLKPGGNHIMFIGLQKHLHEDDMITLKLEFKHAGQVERHFHVAKSGVISEEQMTQHSHSH